MFTLEIDGTAVAIIRSTEERARELLEVEGFKDDLRSMKSDGRPLWTGDAALKLRPSTEEEVETFDDAMDEDEFDDEPEDGGTPAAGGQDAQAADDDEDEDDVDILFLVDIDEDNDAAG